MKNKSKQEKQFVNKQPPSEGILQNTKKKSENSINIITDVTVTPQSQLQALT
jgi:hypothetical protein